ncbi:MAG: hypothetical protein DRJ38_06705 [Thermoprotei archaeon]|nr:MAG: hypothetical protein DRJ38_06705 [Thermoprotei archaeon]
MASLRKDEFSYAILAVIISTSLAVVAVGLPIENFLSEYVVSRNFPWYVPWRVAVAEFLLWICSLLLNTFEEKLSKPLLLFASILFAIAHYYKLYMISPYINDVLGLTCKVNIYPLFYTYTCRFVNGFSGTTLYLDMGQLLLLITFFILIPREVVLNKLKTILGTFHRAP